MVVESVTATVRAGMAMTRKGKAPHMKPVKGGKHLQHERGLIVYSVFQLSLSGWLTSCFFLQLFVPQLFVPQNFLPSTYITATLIITDIFITALIVSTSFNVQFLLYFCRPYYRKSVFAGFCYLAVTALDKPW